MTPKISNLLHARLTILVPSKLTQPSHCRWHFGNEIIRANRIESEKKNKKRCRCPVAFATAIEIRLSNGIEISKYCVALSINCNLSRLHLILCSHLSSSSHFSIRLHNRYVRLIFTIIASSSFIAVGIRSCNVAKSRCLVLLNVDR